MVRDEQVKEIEHELEKALQDAGVSDLVDTGMIRRWITRDDERGGLTHLTMILGLLDPDMVDDTRRLNHLMDALRRFQAQMPSESLGGRSREEHFRRDRADGKPVTLRIEQMRIPPDDWADAYNNANAALSGKDFLTARDGFDEAFELLLRDRTTGREIYRLFGNAGTAYMLTGSVTLGYACWQKALELNPKYTYAREQIEQFESGALDGFAAAGFLGMAAKNIQRRLSLDHLNRAGVLKWPQKKLLERLSRYGVEVDRQGFIEAARRSFSADELAEELFYPVSTAVGMDEDFILFAAEALWLLYCPDEPSVDALGEALEDACKYIGANPPGSEGAGIDAGYRTRLEIIERHLLTGKPGFLAHWTETYEYKTTERRELVSVMRNASGRPGLEAEVAGLLGKLRTRSSEPYLDIVDLNMMLRKNDGRWSGIYSGLRKKLPNDVFIPVLVSDILEEQGDVAGAEACLMEALEVVDALIARPDKPTENMASLRNDYSTVLVRLGTLYEGHASEVVDEDAKRALLAKKNEQMKAMPEIKPLLDKAMDETFSSIEEENSRNSPAMRYYEFLNRFGIDFETEEAPPVKKKLFSVGSEDFDFRQKRRKKEGFLGRLTGKKRADGRWDKAEAILTKAPAPCGKAKIGRNAPCPCGSGKKYKRCCGKMG